MGGGGKMRASGGGMEKSLSWLSGGEWPAGEMRESENRGRK